MSDLTLATKRIVFTAPLPQELDAMERDGAFVYVVREDGLEVIGYQLPGRVMVRPGSGSAAHQLVEDLCIGHWITKER